MTFDLYRPITHLFGNITCLVAWAMTVQLSNCNNSMLASRLATTKLLNENEKKVHVTFKQLYLKLFILHTLKSEHWSWYISSVHCYDTPIVKLFFLWYISSNEYFNCEKRNWPYADLTLWLSSPWLNFVFTWIMRTANQMFGHIKLFISIGNLSMKIHDWYLDPHIWVTYPYITWLVTPVTRHVYFSCIINIFTIISWTRCCVIMY